MFNKDVFRKMKETELRIQVIIPLLRAMGFQDVFDFHGGSGEQGKDIVCWKSDDLGNRVNYAIVLKAGPISGKAQSAKGTAAEVVFQVSQCFGSAYPDPITTEPQQVHRCWVVTNGRIAKEALTSMRSALSSQNFDRLTNFINGDELWEKVLKHLKTQTVLQRLSEAGEILDSLDTHYAVRSIVDGSNIHFTLAEKFPGAAEQKPVNLKITFAFPNTPEGIEIREKLERNFTTGAYPIVVLPEFIQAIEVPDFMKNIFPGTEFSRPTLEIGGPVNQFTVLLLLEFSNEDGELFTLDRVPFIRKQSGTNETTLISELTDIPIEITLVVNFIEHTASYSFRITLAEQNAAQLLSMVKWEQCLSKPFTLRVTHVKDKIVLFEISHPSAFTAPDIRFVEFVADMAEIQQRIKRPIIIPQRAFTKEEINTITELRKVLHDGKIPIHGGINLSVFPRGIPSIMETFGNGRESWIRLEAEETVELFGTEIPIGRVQYSAKAQMINEREVKQTYANVPNDSNPIDIKLKIVEDGKTYYKEYLDWIPQEK